MTNDLVCVGSFGGDVDNFKENGPTFYNHKSQLEYYYGKFGQILMLNMSLQFSNDVKVCNELEEISTGCQNKVTEPVLAYLMNLEEQYTYSEVLNEKILQISGPENINDIKMK